jgi:hypothetical protein
MLDKAFLRLAWGYNAGLPERFVAAWGCRAIYNDDGLIDIVPDSQDWLGRDADRKVLLAVLRRSGWQATVRNRIPKLQPDVVEEFVAYDDGAVVVKVNTNASYGYLYVVAYARGQGNGERDPGAGRCQATQLVGPGHVGDQRPPRRHPLSSSSSSDASGPP